MTDAPVVGMASPRLEEDELVAAYEVLASGSLRQGRFTAQFETELSRFTGAQHAYAVSSGTAALHLAYLSLIEPGEEVLVPAFTFIATASAVALAGGIPVFCDVDPDTLLIDLEDAESRVTPRTRALAVVYLFGNAFDEPAVERFAVRHNLKIVGDSAQALGTRWNDTHVGHSAHLNAHSFYPTKNLFVGEGGMVTTNDAELDDLGRLLRSHGQRPKYHHHVRGLNYRMTDVEAVIGLTQLPKVPDRNRRRREIASRYDAAFADMPHLRCPFVEPGAHHTYHQYTVVVESESPISRDGLQETLEQKGIQSQVNYPVPLHRQPVFANTASPPPVLPVADDLATRVLSLPVHHHLEDDEVERVIADVRAAVQAPHPIRH